MMNEAYMAGFFDGEGCVRINKRVRGKYTEHSVFITIGQKDGATIDWIVENFGGGSYQIKRDDSYVWTATNKIAYNALKRFSPFLKYKKPQADLALEFFEKSVRTHRLTDEEKRRRDELATRLSEEKKIITKSIYCRSKTGSTTKRIDPKGM